MCFYENMVVTISDKKIRLMHLDTFQEQEFEEQDAVTSITVSKSGAYLLINLCTQTLKLWSVKDRVVVREYKGIHDGKYVIRSCFGGVDERFILSGSEGNPK